MKWAGLTIEMREICTSPEHRAFFLYLISCSRLRHIWPICEETVLAWFILMHFCLLWFSSMWNETIQSETASGLQTLYKTLCSFCLHSMLLTKMCFLHPWASSKMLNAFQCAKLIVFFCFLFGTFIVYIHVYLLAVFFPAFCWCIAAFLGALPPPGSVE